MLGYQLVIFRSIQAHTLSKAWPMAPRVQCSDVLHYWLIVFAMVDLATDKTCVYANYIDRCIIIMIIHSI